MSNIKYEILNEAEAPRGREVVFNFVNELTDIAKANPNKTIRVDLLENPDVVGTATITSVISHIRGLVARLTDRKDYAIKETRRDGKALLFVTYKGGN